MSMEGKLIKSDKHEHLKILGAGISGLSTAITLARNSLKVEVFEKNLHAGGRFKRDFQGLRNFGNETIDPIKEFENLGIRIRPYKKLMKIIRYSRSHHFELISNNKPIYYLVLRGRDKNSMDSQLANMASNQGVSIWYNTTLDVNEANIIATGPSKIDTIAYGEIYEDANVDDTGHVFLDNEYSPGGYLYVLPGEKKGEVEIANVVYNPAVTMKETKSLYLRALSNNNILKDLLNGATRKSIQGGIGSFTSLENLYQNNRYYVGEAAGLQDATAGFGIRYAVMSGCLAAQSILTGKDYNEQIAKTLKSRLEFDWKRRENFKKLTNKEIDKTFQLINKKFGHELTVEEYESFRGDI